jgi:hypothetical protein
MPTKIDFGALTEEQTKEIAVKALQELTAEAIAEVIKEAMSVEQFDAVVAILDNP